MSGLLILITIINFTWLGGEPDIREIRQLYVNAATNEDSCKKLMELLKSYHEKTNPLYAGYSGNATMMMAKYLFNPIRKLTYFNKGKALLEKAISIDPGNVELRFLRYCVQTSSPSFLGYSKDTVVDKKLIQDNLPLIKDENLKGMIIRYLNDRSSQTPERK